MAQVARVSASAPASPCPQPTAAGPRPAPAASASSVVPSDTSMIKVLRRPVESAGRSGRSPLGDRPMRQRWRRCRRRRIEIVTYGRVGVASPERTYDLFRDEVEVRPIRKRVGPGTCLVNAAWWLSMLALGLPSPRSPCRGRPVAPRMPCRPGPRCGQVGLAGRQLLAPCQPRPTRRRPRRLAVRFPMQAR